MSREAFEVAIEANPGDNTTRLVYADYLDESGHPDEAAYQRIVARAIREIDLKELRNDYDWASVFGEEDNDGNTTNKTDACPPGADVDTTPPKRADVVEIVAAVNGENDGNEWLGVFRLRDGRFLMANGSCDYTGWD